jgi:hypothetical protein
MFDDQTTSRWIPRNQLGLPVCGYSQASGTESWSQAGPPAQQLQSFDATPPIAFEIGWDDDEFADRRPPTLALVQPPARSSFGAQRTLPTQRATRQMRGSIELQPVAPAVSSQWDLAADIARIRARPRVPLWLRALVPGVALFAAVLFGVVIVFVEPSSAKPAAVVPAPVRTPGSAPTPAPVAQVHADSADTSPAPGLVATPPAESQQAVRHVAARHEAASAKAKQSEASSAARTVADAQAPAALGSGHLGMLRLNTRPWSQVFVDGRLIGNTPIMGVPLQAGEHRVELVNAAMDVRKTIQVKIKPDEVVTKIVLLVD